MPVKTEWTVTYEHCGHTEDKDLSHKAADQRAGFAAWLSSHGSCTDCWRQDQGLPARREWIPDNDEWLAQQRTAELTEAQHWAQRSDMPALSGSSDKQIAFGERVRYQLLGQLHTWCVEDGQAPEDYDAAEELARGLDRSGWWLDQREQADGDPEALLELLHAAAAAGEGTDCENTY